MSSRLRSILCAVLLACACGALLIGALPQAAHVSPVFVKSQSAGWMIGPGETVCGPVAVNYADAKALSALPGIGPKLAEAIVREREQNGPFHYPEDLLSVPGIGEKKLEAIRLLLDLSSGEQAR